MRTLYTVLLYLLTPLVLVRLCLRALGNIDYLWRWSERFGLSFPGKTGGVIWIHAVSVGEVQAAVPLVRALLKKYPDRKILVTTMTPTGSRTVRQQLGTNVLHSYVPYDLPGAINRFLNSWQPEILIIMETELWANTISACRRNDIPVCLVNARMSERSAQRYSRFSGFTAGLLADVTAFAVQSDVDADRLVTLGAARNKISVTGNLKFEINLPPSLGEQAQVMRREWGTDRPVWIAASTHDGEDEAVLDAHSVIRESSANALLILVPRHPERFDAVANLIQSKGFSSIRRSQSLSCGADIEVYLGDTMGELPLLYAAADVAFVGGSLVANGGHNMLEPAGLGIPIVTGPHVFNFSEISRLLYDANAAWQIDNSPQLAPLVAELLGDANRRYAAGEQGKAVVASNRGAVEQVLEIIESTAISP